MNPQEKKKGDGSRLLNSHSTLGMEIQGRERKGVQEEEPTRSKPIHVSESPESQELRMPGVSKGKNAEWVWKWTTDCKVTRKLGPELRWSIKFSLVDLEFA